MGIYNLLPNLSSIIKTVPLSQLSGNRAAIDAYGWLHKGRFNEYNAKAAFEGNYKPLVGFFMKMANKLIYDFGISPVFVFDGGYLPSKLQTEISRAETREKNKLELLGNLSPGRRSMSAGARYGPCLEITPAITAELIQALRKKKIKYIVAPYEADAQLAYLSINGMVDVVFSEDSDCIPFGCKKVLFKMDLTKGKGDLFCAEDLTSNEVVSLDLSDFTSEMFLDMCIFSGCDYLKSPPGIGLKRAHKLFKQYKSIDFVLRALKREGKFLIDSDYETSFLKAKLCFKHQRVFSHFIDYSQDIELKLEARNLNNIDENYLDDWIQLLQNDDFIGPPIPAEDVFPIASGQADPDSCKPYFSIKSTEPTISSKQTISAYFQSTGHPALKPSATEVRFPTSRIRRSDAGSYVDNLANSGFRNKPFKAPRSATPENGIFSSNLVSTKFKPLPIPSTSRPKSVKNVLRSLSHNSKDEHDNLPASKPSRRSYSTAYVTKLGDDTNTIRVRKRSVAPPEEKQSRNYFSKFSLAGDSLAAKASRSRSPIPSPLKPVRTPLFCGQTIDLVNKVDKDEKLPVVDLTRSPDSKKRTLFSAFKFSTDSKVMKKRSFDRVSSPVVPVSFKKIVFRAKD